MIYIRQKMLVSQSNENKLV